MIYTKAELENVEVEKLDETFAEILNERCSSYSVEDYAEHVKKFEVLTRRGHTVVTAADALDAYEILTNCYPVYLKDGTPGWMVKKYFDNCSRESYRGTNIYDATFKFLGRVEKFEGEERRATEEEYELKQALIDAPNAFAGVAPLKEYLTRS